MFIVWVRKNSDPPPTPHKLRSNFFLGFEWRAGEILRDLYELHVEQADMHSLLDPLMSSKQGCVGGGYIHC